ncbi:MAG: esterase family protein [Armatimonadetes bacterium]|nr:esterase family protein [Armatimonadota bacterium]
MFRSHKWWSKSLGQDMEVRVYGHAGKPAIVFPSQEGRFFEYEDFGMVGVCAPYLQAGKLRLITVDSVDGQSWLNTSAHPRARALRHNDYDRYIVDEVIPFVHGLAPGEGVMATGCSMGGYHSANLYFRHPDRFDSLIALSGVYRLNLFIGDYMDEHVYYHVPLAYLSGLEDPFYLEHYRQGTIVVCVGQGAWEDAMVADTRALQKILEDKQVPARIDYWGYDVNHDWVWWRKMMPYFLDSFFS